MARYFLALLVAALVMHTNTSLAAEFPTAPPNLKEMEAKGLPRLTADELKAYFPGVIDSKGPKGRHIIISNPDGTCLRKGFKHGLKDDIGRWRIDETNNTYCRSMPKKTRKLMATGGYEENCFAVFRDPDGTHFFDYDVQDGFFAHVWRRSWDQ